MKQLIFVAIFLLLVGCTVEQQTQPAESMPTNDVVDQQQTPEQSEAQIANPASVKCIEEGYELEMRENAQGQYGVCIFDDGSECEEWAYFREECKRGEHYQD